MSEKYQYYNGLKFTRDEKTGYYLNSTLRIRMHQYVWACEKGEIPKGYHVHHKDGDKSNNDISNLELLTAKEHKQKHWEEKSEEEKQWYRDNFEQKARPAAIEWHKSEEAKEWRSQMVKQAWKDGKLGKKEKFICEICGKEFERIPKPGHKFCSGACSQKFLRQHQPTVKRICIVCGKEYECKQNSLSATCSKHCSNLMWHNPERYKGN